jgi:hypothetical protein
MLQIDDYSLPYSDSRGKPQHRVNCKHVLLAMESLDESCKDPQVYIGLLLKGNTHPKVRAAASKSY